MRANERYTSEFSDSYGMRRGHAKTKSLDRGLTLAKSMKSGPFPPPASSKSNSLNRGMSPGDIFTSCEEDEQAQGVIHQLTMSVLSSDNLDEKSDEEEEEENKVRS